MQDTRIKSFEIRIAGAEDIHFSDQVCALLAESAQARGTGIAKRTPQYIEARMKEEKAVLAISEKGTLAGFCYIETWEHGKYVANSGLIVAESFRDLGLGKQIKAAVFELSRKKYPHAKIFGITTSAAVLRINSDLGYRPVSFSEITKDDVFWEGCKTCVNYDVLTRTNRSLCLCTGMLFDPIEKKNDTKKDDQYEQEKSRISL